MFSRTRSAQHPSPPDAGSDDAYDTGSDLQKTLKQRHVVLIAFGGIIGAGLFVGSGSVINSVGPAVILSYLMGGILVLLVMRMLAEMAAAEPASGSFATYARRYLGNWAGFLTGWLYWYFWVIVVAFEAVAGAATIRIWLPSIPLWSTALIIIVALTAVNLISVKSFGEFEFWFAAIKVLAIVVFLVLGVLYVAGAWPNSTGSIFFLTDQPGGFTPNGWVPVFTGVATLIFSMLGSEIVTVAASESSEPVKAISRATSTLPWRMMMFYVGSVLLLVTIMPWNRLPTDTSPFAAAISSMGIPAAGRLMDVIVLVAVLSCLNSGLYVSSRMIYALTRSGDAPRGLATLNKRGVPVRAILASTTFSYLAVVMAYFSPDTVFYFLTTSSGAVALFVYLAIAGSQIVMRRRRIAAGVTNIDLKMPLFPYLSYGTVVAILGVIALLGFNSDTRPQLYLGLVSVAVLLVAFAFTRRFGRNEE
nr:amino acid permease [Rhodococcus sp. (in: high G+C Gram-positive bacteria)]